jgi:hypothetical protein
MNGIIVRRRVLGDDLLPFHLRPRGLRLLYQLSRRVSREHVVPIAANESVISGSTVSVLARLWSCPRLRLPPPPA